ncbi:MAG: ATP-binding protein [Thermoanaerobaculia bacterium]
MDPRRIVTNPLTQPERRSSTASPASPAGDADAGTAADSAERERAGGRWRFSTFWLPLLAGAALVVATAVLWRALEEREAVQIAEVVRSTTRAVKVEVEQRMRAKTRALLSLRAQGQQSSWSTPEEWRAQASLAFGGFPSFEIVHWLGEEVQRRSMAGNAAWDAAEAAALVDNALFRESMQRAATRGEPVAEGPFSHRLGSMFQIVVPPSEPGDGYLAAAFEARKTFSNLTETVAPGYRVVVSSPGGVLFSAGPEIREPARRWAVSRPLELPGGSAWRVTAAPGPGLLADYRSGLPEVVLGAGVVIAILLTSTLRYGALTWARAEELEGRVRERTVELREALDRIRDENRERRRTEATLRRFLITLGHELRNPLGSIVTALDVLEDRELEGRGDPRMHQIVRRQVGHLAHLVDDLLDISRIERGKVSLQREPVDLPRLVRDLVEGHRAEADAAGVSLELDVPEDAAWVEADTTRIVQVVENLLSNAIKFTDSGGRVELGVEARGGGEVLLRVRDTGCGLDPGETEQIFEPFAQLGEAQRRMSGGLGLGLPIVKGLVEAHGGRLEVASEGRGRGAEFRVRLPAAEEPVEPAVEPGPASELVPLSVLLIDDHRDSAEGLAELLRAQGHRVGVSYDGESGIDAARRTLPDVVISDLGLPGLDGYGVARTLRESFGTRSPRLVALSGYGDAATVEKALQAGFDHHLTKPVDPAALQKLLGAIAGPASSTASA